MTGTLRPAFARDFPRDPELDSLVSAFARGDFSTVRSNARKLANDTAIDARVREAAGVLAERIRPDPLAAGLVALSAALLIALGGFWSMHGQAPASPRTLPSPARSVPQ